MTILLMQNMIKYSLSTKIDYFVLDGWIKESFSDIFSNFFNAHSQEEKLEARNVIIKKMNSLISPELKEHVYAVARSSRIL